MCLSLRTLIPSDEGPTHVCVCSVISTLLWAHGLQPTGLLCQWSSPGKNTGVGCYSFLQGIFLTQGLNPCLLCLLHWRHTLYHRATWVIITTSFYLNDIHKNSVSKCVTLGVGDYREPKHSVHCRCSVTQSTRVAPWTVHTRSPIHPHLLELTQTHVHWVSDSIQLRQKLLSSQQGRAVINFCSIYLREKQLVTINLKPITGQGAGKMVVTYFED